MPLTVHELAAADVLETLEANADREYTPAQLAELIAESLRFGALLVDEVPAFYGWPVAELAHGGA